MATPAVRKSTAASGRTTPKGTTPRGTKKKGGVWTDPESGEVYAVTGKINTFLLLKIEADTEDNEFNAADIYRLLVGMVDPKDRSGFITAMSRKADLDAERLNELMTGMLEVAAGRNPSSSPTGSGRTARSNTSRELSAVN
jgi:hypothetical protein